jgi:hypothetical protein
MDLKANLEEMEPEVEHREVSKKLAAVKVFKAPSKRYRDGHLAAGRRGKRNELTQGGSWLPPASRNGMAQGRIYGRTMKEEGEQRI